MFGPLLYTVDLMMSIQFTEGERDIERREEVFVILMCIGLA